MNLEHSDMSDVKHEINMVFPIRSRGDKDIYIYI